MKILSCTTRRLAAALAVLPGSYSVDELQWVKRMILSRLDGHSFQFLKHLAFERQERCSFHASVALGHACLYIGTQQWDETHEGSGEECRHRSKHAFCPSQ